MQKAIGPPPQGLSQTYTLIPVSHTKGSLTVR